jgi:hypothetical protein
MRIIRMVHKGSVSFALALPLLALGGGCDGGSSSAPASVKETPEEAAARGKHISEMYKQNPPNKKPSGAPAPAPANTSAPAEKK